MFQAIANWGASKGGALGTVALNVGAGLNAASEAFGTNDLGAAAGEGNVGGMGLAVLGMLPVGKAGKLGKAVRAFGNIDGGVASADEALGGAIRWLGDGSKEIARGVFRSADNTRQFRMTVSDLTDKRKGMHVHFESIGPDGREILENSHVRIVQ